ncbi:MAG: pyridoxamine 5'-phosphate oxidase [Bacteroidetes bacterium]|nr:pyridoxamine 5'-phosphate oxidase [Bacteroidota bacterium]
MNPSIADIRKTYAQAQLLESETTSDPMEQFEKWWQQAVQAAILEVNAMTLATVGADGMPDARIVLLKGVDGQGFHFYTNYQSRKGQQLETHPQAALVLFWKELERQVRIKGRIERLPDAESDSYFHSRPRESQLGAVSSPQSAVIVDRKWLEERYRSVEASFEGKEITRPAHWGGYKLIPESIEFWQGRPGRMHDRLEYKKDPSGSWLRQRLAP